MARGNSASDSGSVETVVEAAPAVAAATETAPASGRKARSPQRFTGIPVAKEVFEAWATTQVPSDPNIPAYSRTQLRAMFVAVVNRSLAASVGVTLDDATIKAAQLQGAQV